MALQLQIHYDGPTDAPLRCEFTICEHEDAAPEEVEPTDVATRMGAMWSDRLATARELTVSARQQLTTRLLAKAESSSDTNEMPDDVATAGRTTPEGVSGDPEKEVFYSFKWGRRRPRRNAQQGAENSNPSGTKKPNKRKPKPKKRPESTGAKKFQSRPEKKQAIDPDNPFAAALMGLKTKE